MTPLDLPALAALAEAADNGEWSAETNGYVVSSAGRLIVYAKRLQRYDEDGAVIVEAKVSISPANLAYIAAADPTTILALIRRVQAAEADRDRLRDCLDDSHKDFAELATSERKATVERDRLQGVIKQAADGIEMLTPEHFGELTDSEYASLFSATCNLLVGEAST